MSQQGKRQASVRAVTGTAEHYEGDWHALFDLAGIPAGMFNERMLQWINLKLAAAYQNLSEAQQALAVSIGATNFGSIGDFDADVAPPAPVNVILPAISGILTVGQTLTVSNGTWTGSPSGYTYAWQNAGVSISGATAQTYVTQPSDAGDLITCEVTATNVTGSATAEAPGVTPVSTATIIRFGALTPAGFGGHPVSGTAVATGDASGHFQVTDGYLVPSAAGFAASLNLGPYSLVMDDGEVIDASIVANAYHIRAAVGAQAEWDGASGVAKKTAAVLAGKTIFLRAGSEFACNITGATGTPFRRMSFGTSGTGWAGLTVESDDLTNPAVFTDTMSSVTFQYFTLRGVQFTPSALAKVILQGSATFPVTDIWIDQNEMNGVTRGWTTADYPAVATYATHFGNTYAINNNGTPYNSNIKVTGNLMRYTSGIALGATSPAAAGSNGTPGGNLITVPLTVSGNEIDVYWAIAVRISYGGADNLAVVEDNVVTRCVSISDDTGNPHQDGIYFNGNAVATTDWTVKCNRNIVLKSDGRGSPAPIAYRDFIATLGTISAITKASPGVVTLSAPPNVGLEIATGQRVRISGMTGMTELNGREFTIDVLSTTTFNLRDAGTGVLVDTTAYGTFTSVGTNSIIRISGKNFIAEIIGNVVNCRSSEGLLVQNAKNCVVLNNTITKDDYPSANKADLRIGGVIADGFTSSGTHRVERNVAEAISAQGVTIDSSNVVMGANAVTHPYATVFDGPTWVPLARADVLTLLSRKVGGPADLSGGPPDAGAVGSSAVTWATTVPGDDGANLVS